MATLAQRIADLATRIATECKAIRTMVNGNVADLSTLSTTNKSNLVAAVNEVKQAITDLAAVGATTINDASTTSTTQTWSVAKILEELEDTAAAVKDEILGGAGAAYDTLAELQALLQGEAADIASIMTALDNRVRVDTAAQGLNATQKQNARTNIGADVTSAQTGDTDTNFVTTFNTGLS